MSYKGFHYTTINEMSDMIMRNIYKIPHDIDFVIGVPRSGMLPASIIAEYINVALIDVDSFIHGAKPTGGNRLNFIHYKAKPKPKVLVIDDTIFSGSAMAVTKSKLEPLKEHYEFIYAVAYKEGAAPNTSIDLWLDDNSKYIRNDIQCIYQWNFLNHYSHVMSKCIYDIDGLLCLDPPDDRNTEKYEQYIKNATPLLCPTSTIGKICTYRIIKYKDITKEWLAKNGIKYNDLIMFNAQSREERNNSGVGPAEFKAGYYKQDSNSILFVESDDWQARRIYELTGKQVLCTQSNTMYGEINV